MLKLAVGATVVAALAELERQQLRRRAREPEPVRYSLSVLVTAKRSSDFLLSEQTVGQHHAWNATPGEIRNTGCQMQLIDATAGRGLGITGA